MATDSLKVPQELAPVGLVVTRCYDCGRYWAYESWGASSTRCPKCAGDDLDKLEEQISALKKTIAALRGALKRKR